MRKAVQEATYTDRQGRTFLSPVIESREDGSLVLPPEVLKALHIKGCETFTFDVDEEQGSITMYAVGDDDWLYTPEMEERHRQAQADISAGRMREMSAEDLLSLPETD